MADTLISVALETLIPEILKVYGKIRGVKEEIDKLKETLSLIQDVLEDAEQKQFQDEKVQKWLWRLRDVAYDAEDILEEWATKARKQNDETQSQITQLISKYIPSPFNVKYHYNMAKKIKEINEKFDAIKKESSDRLQLVARVANARKEVGESSRDPTDSSVDSSKIWGRDEDKKNIVKMLLNGINYEKDIFVLPIVGMGGLGKTTLAQLVYNDPLVVGHFNLRMWICVSENFELIRLTRDILESATRTNINLVTLNPLQESLQEKLKGKKFLLVLDDVWNEDPEKWCRLKGILNCSKESAIIVTTRSESIASMMSLRSQDYKLKGLSEDHCWSLFEQRAFGGRSSEESPNLVAIGKQIVKKCGGLPLAVNALGSLLFESDDELEWKYIRDSETWKWPNAKTNILPALRLSYDHLPIKLRRCFGYCSLFPKDHRIEKENLIYLWIANDFILPKQGMELEDVGNQILNELVRRSLLQVVHSRFHNKIFYQMHDLLHDLARYVTGNEFFTLENGEVGGVPKETRHIVCVGKTIPKSLCDVRKVRGLFLKTYGAGESLDFSNLRWLRLLDLSWCGIKELSSSIGNLLYLRYLNLSGNDFTTIPESFSNLMNLQTLILNNCQHLLELPKEITRKMNGLMHLDVSDCDKLMVMPDKIGQLTSLRKLPTFIVGEGSECGINQLGDLNHIRELSIMRLERVRYVMDPQEAKLLFNKKNLRVLKLSWDEGLTDGEAIQAEETLNHLQPCEKLEQLMIHRYPGNQFSSWLQASLVLPDLVVIDLHGCYNSQSLPPFGQLPRLKRLGIKDMHAVKYIGVDLYSKDKSKSFPSLLEFKLEGMDNLEEWSFVEDQRKVFPCLNKLTITNLGKLSRFPEGLLRDCTMLKTLELKKCQKLRTLGRELNNLVALEWLTIDSSCEEMECLSEVGIRGLTCLRELKIMKFPKLTTISPVLEGLSSLKTIEIYQCGKLMSLPEGIGKLIHLEILKIRACKSLTSFPQEGIGGLTSLQNLHLVNLPNLTSLPEGIGGLTSLQNLHLLHLPNLTSLPEGIGGLSSLQCLELTNLPILTYLRGGLTSLRVLSLANLRNLTYLPEEIGGFTSIQVLNLISLPKLTYLPEGIGGLVSLNELDISWCDELSNVPLILQRLTALKKLTLRGFDCLKFLPEGGFASLTELGITVGDCKELFNLPATLQRHTTLKELRLSGFDSLNFLVEGLPSLEKLTISSCNNLTSLSEEGIRGLTRLEVLIICGCSKLSSLPAALQQLTSLRELKIWECENLASLPEEGVRGLTALEVLDLHGCSKLSKLPAALQHLTSLRKLKIWKCENLTSLPEEGVRGLTALEKLEIDNCQKLSTLPAALQQLTSLRELRIWNCENLTSLPEEGVRGLAALEKLDIDNCQKLSTLPAALQQLTSLRELKLWNCENLTSLPEDGVRGLTALEVLRIRNCSNLSKLPAALQQLTIQTLTISGCHPDLLRQVVEKTGEEWLKIKHIPHIYVM